MDEIKFFDGCCMVGRKARKEIWEPEIANINDLQKEMQRLNICEALIYHSTAKYSNPTAGNHVLLNEAKEYQNIHISWVMTPDILWEEDVSHYFDRLVRYGFKAVRMFPKSHGFLFNRRTCGGIFDELARRHIPLFIDLSETSWKEIDEFLTLNNSVSLVITQLSSWADDRYFFPLFRDFQNLYIVSDYYKIMGGLENICSKFGADRIIFGSGLPERAPGGPISMILYSELSETEKIKIAYGNLKTLLDGVSCE